MDTLVCFWCEDTHKAVTKYLTSFFPKGDCGRFGLKKIMAHQEKSKLLFECIFNTSWIDRTSAKPSGVD